MPSASSGYQTGNRHAEVALAADAPVDVQVLGPVPVAQAHEVGMPAHLVARREQLGLLVEQPHEPLPRRDELERPVALLVELDGVLDRLRLARSGAPRRSRGVPGSRSSSTTAWRAPDIVFPAIAA